MPKGDYPTIEENMSFWIDWFGHEAVAKAYLKSHGPDKLLEVMLSQESIDRSALMQALIQQIDKKQARQLLQGVLANLGDEEDEK